MNTDKLYQKLDKELKIKLTKRLVELTNEDKMFSKEMKADMYQKLRIEDKVPKAKYL